VLFRFVIRRWNLRTPGREDDPEVEVEPATSQPRTTGPAPGTDSGTGARP
jgi:N-acetylglucosamine PTS system EIICBA or EIICB component